MPDKAGEILLVRTELSIPVYTPKEFEELQSAPVDNFYIGEPFCSKRFEFYWPSNALRRVVETVRGIGKKVFLFTVADVSSEKDLQANHNILAEADKLRVDGVIINDWSVFRLLQKIGHGLQKRLGNLLPVYNPLDVDFFKSNDISVIHVPEDLSKEQLVALVHSTRFPFEITIHGPIVLNLSWVCAYERLCTDTDDPCKRGCAQYDRRFALKALNDGDEVFMVGGKFLASARNLCLISFLPEILRLVQPASVFIETRLRGTEYGARIAEVYRDALSLAECNEEDFGRRDWLGELKRLGQREFCNGYYLGANVGRIFLLR